MVIDGRNQWLEDLKNVLTVSLYTGSWILRSRFYDSQTPTPHWTNLRTYIDYSFINYKTKTNKNQIEIYKVLILLISRAELNFAFDVVTSFATLEGTTVCTGVCKLVVQVTFERTDHHALCCCVPFLWIITYDTCLIMGSSRRLRVNRILTSDRPVGHSLHYFYSRSHKYSRWWNSSCIFIVFYSAGSYDITLIRMLTKCW